jgi:hypothetical protein
LRTGSSRSPSSSTAGNGTGAGRASSRTGFGKTTWFRPDGVGLLTTDRQLRGAPHRVVQTIRRTIVRQSRLSKR